MRTVCRKLDSDLQSSKKRHAELVDQCDALKKGREESVSLLSSIPYCDWMILLLGWIGLSLNLFTRMNEKRLWLSWKPLKWSITNWRFILTLYYTFSKMSRSPILQHFYFIRRRWRSMQTMILLPFKQWVKKSPSLFDLQTLVFCPKTSFYSSVNSKLLDEFIIPEDILMVLISILQRKLLKLPMWQQIDGQVLPFTHYLFSFSYYLSLICFHENFNSNESYLSW